MKCKYCNAPTDTFTSLDEPICEHCAQEQGFLLCTDLGKYIAAAEFSCDYDCSECSFCMNK